MKTSIFILFTRRQGEATTTQKWNIVKQGLFYHPWWFIHLNKCHQLLLNITLGFGDTVVNKAQSTCSYVGDNLVVKRDVNV